MEEDDEYDIEIKEKKKQEEKANQLSLKEQIKKDKVVEDSQSN